MTTTAAVWLEDTDETIFVGMDGYPSYMVPLLGELQSRGQLHEVVKHSDYMRLGDGSSEVTRKAGIPVAHGVLYREQGERLTVAHDSFTNSPMFFDGESIASPDHKYTVTKNGAVIAHHRY